MVLGLAGHEEDQHVLALDRHRVDKSAMRILPDQRLEEASLNFFRRPREDNVFHIGLQRHRETRDVAARVG